MANKGMSKIGASMSSLFGKSTKAEKSDKTLSKENREREVLMREKLSSLLDDLQYDAKIQKSLKSGWINKEDCDQTKRILAQVIRDLETPRVTERDEEGLDKLIIGFVDALCTEVQLSEYVRLGQLCRVQGNAYPPCGCGFP